ncbi:MAG: class I SAM-dependent rRNA methyltransferase [Candidatus Latescibacteria bacterium]|nr:class I SAM-dependent rRNA methyltransferase [Candidatus Latescibacterota bacterium]
MNKVWVVRKKQRRQHSWVFSNEIKQVEYNPELGDAVLVYDRDKFIGSGIYNPRSLIAVRLYSAQEKELDKSFFVEQIKKAIDYRKTVLPEEIDYRMVYGESDGLPGVAIDRFHSSFALQTFSSAMDKRQDIIISALQEILAVDCVVEKNDFRLRDAEGLARRESLLFGTGRQVLISENKVKYLVDLMQGQKTGFYYDQRVTRARVRALSKDKDVLDVFCYTGGFAINAALAQARSVIAIDASEPAIMLARQNAELNSVAHKIQFEIGDAFKVLRDYHRQQRKFDLINLDPPPFFKSQKEKKQGLRGYKDINLQAMRLLKDGGILVSSTCSHYLFWQDLFDVLSQAAQSVDKTFKIIDRTTQGPDHPVLLSMPESEYLRCYFLEVH